MLFKKLFAWLILYIIIAGSLSIFFSILALLHTIFPTALGDTSLLLIYVCVLLILIGIGIVSLLPLSEYTYARQGGLNPAIAREGYRHYTRRKHERREYGILLGIVGITSIIGINPWSPLFFLLSPLVGIHVVTFLMAISLTLLTIIYRRQLHRYIRPETYQNETD